MHNIASGSRLAMRRRDAAIVEIEQWALDYADRLSRNIGEQGVAVGARIACDAPWEHFDLKVAVLVDERDAGVSHYLVDSGRGIEIFQLERDRLAHEVGRVVATYLSTSVPQVYALVRSGELPAIKLGGRGVWRVDRNKLDAFLDDLEAKTAEWAKAHPLNPRDKDSVPEED